MKHMKWMVGCVALFLAVGYFGVISAKAESIVKTETGKSYQIDLDSDGTEEEVELKQYPISEDMEDYYYGILYVNGEKLYATSKEDYGYTIQMNFITCGSQVFINLRQTSDNDNMVFNKLLSFSDENIKELVDFKEEEPGMRSCHITKATQSKIIVQCEAQPSQLASVLWNATYVVSDDSVELKSAVHKVTSDMEGHSVSTFVTNRSLKFTDKIGSKEVSFTLTKGKKVKLVSITTRKNGKIFGCFKYGDKKGYLRVDPYYNTAYFKNVYEYLAG